MSQQCFPDPTIADIKLSNKLLREARDFKDLAITVQSIDPDKLCMTATSDAAWGNVKSKGEQEESLASQAGYIVMAAHRDLLDGHLAQITPLAWRSHTLKRKAASTLSAESQAVGEAAAITAWFRYLLVESMYPETLNEMGSRWEDVTDQLEYGLVTDAKSIYDALTRPTSTASTISDKRTAIDLAIIRDELRRSKGCIRWIDTKHQLADSLTKVMSPDLLRYVIGTGKYQIKDELDALRLKEVAKRDRAERRQANQSDHDKLQQQQQQQHPPPPLPANKTMTDHDSSHERRG